MSGNFFRKFFASRQAATEISDGNDQPLTRQFDGRRVVVGRDCAESANQIGHRLRVFSGSGLEGQTAFQGDIINNGLIVGTTQVTECRTRGIIHQIYPRSNS